MEDARKEAEQIVASLKQSGIESAWDTEIVALIAYLQKLGTGLNP